MLSARELLEAAGTLTVCRGLSPTEALRVLVADPAIGPGPVEDAHAWWDAQPLEMGTELSAIVEAAPLGSLTLLHEPNGSAACDEDNLRALSRNGFALSVYFSVNMDAAVSWAVDGQVVRAFDPVLYDEAAAALPEEHGLDFAEDPVGASLELVERLTGGDLLSELPPLSEHTAVGYVVVSASSPRASPALDPIPPAGVDVGVDVDVDLDVQIVPGPTGDVARVDLSGSAFTVSALAAMPLRQWTSIRGGNLLFEGIDQSQDVLRLTLVLVHENDFGGETPAEAVVHVRDAGRRASVTVSSRSADASRCVAEHLATRLMDGPTTG